MSYLHDYKTISESVCPEVADWMVGGEGSDLIFRQVDSFVNWSCPAGLHPGVRCIITDGINILSHLNGGPMHSYRTSDTVQPARYLLEMDPPDWQQENILGPADSLWQIIFLFYDLTTILQLRPQCLFFGQNDIGVN